ncbi:WG repeat-containing protein [Anabaena sp. UHCC 0253]|uniref:WG repeat-containing protein n=1 Tax=Anabaena sp. UHCC 0253 TaxID=2590019 RepID=UPI0020C3C4A2|nr:WG repeat-containing protein [Anabaena sp. UHCC 0253]
MISCSSDSSPLFPVYISGKIGYINTQGKLVIDAKFGTGGTITSNFSADGLAAASSNNKCGYIDKTGKTVINFIYNTCYDFSEELALVSEVINSMKQEYKYSYIDKSGNTVIDFEKLGFKLYNPSSFDSQPLNFSEGLTLYQMKDQDKLDRIDQKVGFIDKSGKIIIPAQFAGATKFSEGLSLIFFKFRTNDDESSTFGFIDKTGKLVIDLSSTDITLVSLFSEDLASVMNKNNRKWGFIDTTGKIVIEPQFDLVGQFSEGLAEVEVNNKWGFIGKSGNIVINPTFERVQKFSEGLAAVRLNDKWKFIDKNGNTVINLIDEYPEEPFSNGLARIGNKNSEYGYIDKSGNYVWKPTK